MAKFDEDFDAYEVHLVNPETDELHTDQWFVAARNYAEAIATARAYHERGRHAQHLVKDVSRVTTIIFQVQAMKEEGE